MDWSPRPERIALEDAYVRLEPLDPGRHGGHLFHSARQEGTEDRFRCLFDAVSSDETSFARWLEAASASADSLLFAVIDKSTGRTEGHRALMRIDPAYGVIEIGNILWGPAITRSRAATEALFLFASYAFDTLGYRRFEWKWHNANTLSKRAAERFGFTFEGVFRNHMVVKGKN